MENKKTTMNPSNSSVAKQTPKVDGNVDVDTYDKFLKTNEALLKKYCGLADQHVKLSIDMILAHPEILLSSDAETYVLFTCLELSMNDHDVEMKALARQAQLIIQALELTKSLNRTEALPKTLISKMYEHLLESYAVRESGGASKKKAAKGDDEE